MNTGQASIGNGWRECSLEVVLGEGKVEESGPGGRSGPGGPNPQPNRYYMSCSDLCCEIADPSSPIGLSGMQHGVKGIKSPYSFPPACS